MAENGQHHPGEQVGNYRLQALLGRGGFSEVYLGEHRYLKTLSAIKMLRLSLDEAAFQRFLTEARVIAQLEHPHIVRVLDYGMSNGHPFLVMSYAPNGSLRQRIPRGTRVSPHEVAGLLEQVASALAYAHHQKLIHRDIKPENLLLDARGQVLLSDFGLVIVAQSTGSQATRDIGGTIPYMAPEQLQGRARFASDQYALGVVAYEWLCGERPFVGSFAAIASQQMLAVPPSLCARVPGLSPAIEQVVLRALAKDPTRRYESVELFAEAFRNACQAPLSSLPSSAIAHVPTRSIATVSGERTVTGSTSMLLASSAGITPVILPVMASTSPLQSRSLPEQSLSSLSQQGVHKSPSQSTGLVARPSGERSRRNSAVLQAHPAQPKAEVLWRMVPLVLALLALVVASAGVAWMHQTPHTASGSSSSMTHTSDGTPIVHAQPIQTASPSGNTPTTGATAEPASPPAPAFTPTHIPAPAPDCLTASPSNLTFTELQNGAPPSQRAVTLVNCGGSTTLWSAVVQTEDGMNWLSVNPSGNTLQAKQSETVLVDVSGPSLSPRTYQGSITLTKGSAHRTVTVFFTIIAG